MYITAEQIEIAVKNLDPIHPFWGTSFLAFKQLNLRVDKPIVVDITKQEISLLDAYYNPWPTSKYYYVPLRGSGPKNRWRDKKKYSSSGLQKVRTTTFMGVFSHPQEDKWAWSPNYIERLKTFIKQKQQNTLVPIFYLAVWMWRERKWPTEITAKDIVQAFLKEFSITPEEQSSLFDISIPKNTDRMALLQERKVSWDELRKFLGDPPDAPLEEGGALTFLKIKGVGTASSLTFEPAERLNLITGDNGLGKTFLLETAWWALTGEWADLPAYPRQPDAEDAEDPKIIFQISGESKTAKKIEVPYDWLSQSWPSREKRPTIPGLLIYARVDGSFAVWDPTSLGEGKNLTSRPLVFDRQQVWDGYKKEINGLIDDWIRWQNRPDQQAFETLKKVLHRLSPPDQSDLGVLEPGKPVRLPGDAREIPTLAHPYGDVPIVYVAAGVRRIITLAYLIVWAWEEHKIHSVLKRKDLARKLVILVDEVEAHLHPQWQRQILPAVMSVQEDLASDLQVQLIVSTHSPLVLASVEPIFDIERDKLFHLDFVANNLFGDQVELREMDFIRHGPVNSWLMSDVFGLRYARSLKAEKAIEEAKSLQAQNNPKPEDVQRVSDELMRYLSANDDFWPRWVLFAEQHGVHL